MRHRRFPGRLVIGVTVAWLGFEGAEAAWAGTLTLTPLLSEPPPERRAQGEVGEPARQFNSRTAQVTLDPAPTLAAR